MRQDIVNLAARRGGICANPEEYVTGALKLTWQCLEGHSWVASTYAIRHGSWCPHCKLKCETLVRAFMEFVTGTSLPSARPKWLRNCGGPRAWYQLDGLNEGEMLAFEYHGPQHYREVKAFHRDGITLGLQQARDAFIRKKCAERGIRLIEVSTLPLGSVENQVAHIRAECEVALGPICDETLAAFLEKPFGSRMLDKLKAYAESKSGLCLSPIFTGVRTKYRWQCKDGHQWEANWTHVQDGRWCPTCGNQFGPSAKLLTDVAHSRGGICLNPTEYSRKANLGWRCCAGHEWTATWTSVQQGNWCPECAWERFSADFKVSASRLVAHAESLGGQCLDAEDYDGNTRKLRWRCGAGHEWEATWASVQQDHWCPKCRRAEQAAAQREPIASVIEKAANLGYELLSPADYKNSSTRMEWRCSAGHSWTAPWCDIKRGRLCRACKRLPATSA